MNEKATKKAQTKDKIKNKLYEVAALLLFAAMFVTSVCGVVSSRTAKREYASSDDIRKVTVVVERTKNLGGRDDLEDYKTEAKLSFVIDGKAYNGTETFYREIYQGGKVAVEYRTSKGVYNLSPNGNPVAFLFNCIAILLGGFLTIAMLFAVFSKKSPSKRRKAPK